MVTDSIPAKNPGDRPAGESPQISVDAPRVALIEEAAILRTVARLRSAVLAVVLGGMMALGMFAATAWLIVKGGEDVGAHLQLLSQYFIGYSVTWSGSIVGALYGFLVGAIMGGSIGLLYNRIVDLRSP